MAYKKKTIQQDFIDYVSNASCDFDTAVSLTFAKEPLNTQQASRTFNWFLNKLNDDCYGNNWQRRAKHIPSARIAIVPILADGFGYKRLHYHCAAVKPKNLNDWQFEKLILMLWDNSYLGSKEHNKIEPIWNKKGWAKYISEELTLDTADIIDEKNIHIY